MNVTRNSILAFLTLAACSGRDAATPSTSADSPAPRLAKYTTVKLEPDLSKLSAKERQMIPLLVDAAKAMDEVYWIQAYGSRDSLLNSITDADTKRLAEINYGPWDRLDENHGFVAGAAAKPAGSNFYPANMTKAEFDSAVAKGGKRADSLKSLYTMVRRDSSGALVTIPYSVFFKAPHERAAALLDSAAKLADDPGLRRYLSLRARALRTDAYQPSDMAWMDMKNNAIDFVVGPIETYDDELYGYKASHEAVVLLKDADWSRRLSRYAGMLPSLQRGIPVDAAYKRETPGSKSDLNAYDVVYVAGQSNVGAKTIAINLPNDEQVQAAKGTRRLQLKNAMRAKFDRILVPIARELIADDQLPKVTFDAFFENVMFHEVAHGLGVSKTIDGKGTVRAALKERYGALEEGKADILGLYMVQQLRTRNEMTSGSMDDNYVAFLASIFRSVRFGSADAHGRANIAALNFLEERGAFTRDSATGKYRVDFAKMQQGANDLAATILKLQGDGDYEGVGAFQTKYGTLSAATRGDLDRLKAKGIPVDIVYQQ